MSLLSAKRACDRAVVGKAGERSFEDRVVPHRELLRRYALRLSGSPTDADDLVQETLARALKSADALPDDGVIERWLCVTLYRLFVDQCRRRKAETKAFEGIRHISTAATAARPTALPRWMTVSDEEVRAAVEALPETLRSPYVLRARGKSYQAIADELDLGINTVSTRIRRARLAMRETLTGKTRTPEDSA